MGIHPSSYCFFPHIRESCTFPQAITNGPICCGICSQLGHRVWYVCTTKKMSVLKQGNQYALLSCSKIPVVPNTVFTTLYLNDASTELYNKR